MQHTTHCHHHSQNNQKKLFHKTVFAFLAGIVVFIVSMMKLPPFTTTAGQLTGILLGVIALAALIYSGGHFFVSAVKALKNRTTNMDTLIALSTGIAWLYSSVIVIFPGLVPELARHQYYESAIFIIALVNLGALLEMSARGKTSAAIKKLLELKPKTASVIRNEIETEVPVQQVQLNDIVRIKPGQSIPVDGIIVQGESYIDQAMLTGEAVAVHKKPGDAVIAGTLNKQGGFLFKVTKIGSQTMLAQIIAYVQRAQNSKPPIARLADKVSAVFVPAVILIAIITALIWWIAAPAMSSTYMLVTAVSVLIVACPCAIGLAIPMSVMLGIGKAAEYGVLIRNGEALQQAGSLTTLILDKTGTVTEGQPKLTTIKSLQADWDEERILQYAASVEVNSEHPLAQAIVQAARQRNYQLLQVQKFLADIGYGVSAEINGQRIVLGNQKIMQKNNIAINELTQEDNFAKAGQTPILMAVNQTIIAILAVADPVKTDSAAAIARLKNLGLTIAMVTGDHQQTAQAVAQQVNIQQIYADVLPHDKAKIIADLQNKGEKVGMAGDGINDAPALMQANVGFALGSGSDIAIESASVTLLKNSLHSVADAIAISRATISNMQQNLFGAFIYNVLAIPLAAGILYPVIHLLLSPVIAGAAMALSSLTVVGNANRLLAFKPNSF